jgi:hypothetical protein
MMYAPANKHAWTAAKAGTLLNMLSNLAYILLLVAFFRQSDDQPRPNIPIPDVPICTQEAPQAFWILHDLL